MPWLAASHVNDVYRAKCEPWPVKPIDATTKKPFYSSIPVPLLTVILTSEVMPTMRGMRKAARRLDFRARADGILPTGSSE